MSRNFSRASLTDGRQQGAANDSDAGRVEFEVGGETPDDSTHRQGSLKAGVIAAVVIAALVVLVAAMGGGVGI